MIRKATATFSLLALGAGMALFANSASAVTENSLVGQFRSLDCTLVLRIGANNQNYETCVELDARIDVVKDKIDRLGGLSQTIGSEIIAAEEAGNTAEVEKLRAREKRIWKRLARVWLLFTGDQVLDQ